jgi:hypothetical protein
MQNCTSTEYPVNVGHGSSRMQVLPAAFWTLIVVPSSVFAVSATETNPSETIVESAPGTGFPQPSNFVTRIARPRTREKHLFSPAMTGLLRHFHTGLLGEVGGHVEHTRTGPDHGLVTARLLGSRQEQNAQSTGDRHRTALRPLGVRLLIAGLLLPWRHQ